MDVEIAATDWAAVGAVTRDVRSIQSPGCHSDFWLLIPDFLDSRIPQGYHGEASGWLVPPVRGWHFRPAGPAIDILKFF